MRALGIAFDDRIEPFTLPVNWAEFRAFSPTGQVPALIDGATTVWDSLGITLYLADRHAGVWPEQGAARAFAQCVVTEMHGGFSALRNRCTMNVGVRARMPSIPADLARDIARVTEILTEAIDRFGGPWLTGAAFTAADAFYAPVAFRIRTYGIDVGPTGQRWVDTVLAHPAMLEWEAAALSETWREAEHEADLARCGAVTADYRKS
jgi:glutathione S-transferase